MRLFFRIRNSRPWAIGRIFRRGKGSAKAQKQPGHDNASADAAPSKDPVADDETSPQAPPKPENVTREDRQPEPSSASHTQARDPHTPQPVIRAAVPASPAASPRVSISLPPATPQRQTPHPEETQDVTEVPQKADLPLERPGTPPSIRRHRLWIRENTLLNAIITPTTSARAALDQLYMIYMLDKRMVDLSILVPYFVNALGNLKYDDFVDMTIRQPGTSDTYDIVSCLGAGVQGWVFQAVAPDGQSVAMKIYNKADLYATEDKSMRATIETELNALKSAAEDGSPYLAKALAAWSDLCFVYIVMPLAHLNLCEWIMEDGRPPVPFKLYAAELVSALSSFHRMQYVHREVNPKNILVLPSGHMSLSDFGRAFLLDGDAHPTQSVGSVEYAAPEVVSLGLFGTPYYGQPADVWSLGVVLLELATSCSTPIYCDKNLSITLLKILQTEAKLIPQMQMVQSYDPVLHDLLLAMLKRDPAARITIEEVKLHPYFADANWDDLESWAAQNDMVAWKPPSPTDKLPKAIVAPEGFKATVDGHKVLELLLEDANALSTSDAYHFQAGAAASKSD